MSSTHAGAARVPIRHSLAYRILKVVFAVYFVFAVSITGYHMRLDYVAAEEHIASQLVLIEKAFEDSLATALFDLDAEQLQSILSGLREMHTLVGVDISASNPDIFIPDAAIGTILDASGRGTVRVDGNGSRSPSDIPVEALIVRGFVLHQPGTSIEIARGRLYSSSQVVFDRVEGGYVRLISSAVAKTALLWVLFLWAASGRLSAPLRRFAQDVARADLDSGRPVELVVPEPAARQRRNELHLLGDAFNAMQARLRDYVDSLKAEKHSADLARAQAERATREKSTLLSRMSHELRTPLNAIIGLSEIQSRRPSGDARRDRGSEQILAAGQELLKLIDDVMGVVEVPQSEVRCESCELDEFVRQAVLSVSQAHPMNQVTVVAKPTGCYVSADPALLARVLFNVISNAVLYNVPGGSVHISATRRPEDRVLVEIEDVGVGFAPEEHEVVFEPFGRLAYAHENRVPGTGMGLVVARKFAESMQGTLEVASEPGCGTTVAIELRAAHLVPFEVPAQASDRELEANLARGAG